MEASRALAAILRTRIVPIIRTASAAWAEDLAGILVDAGLDILEITFTVPDAAAVIGRVRKRFPAVLVGAGTVTDAAAAKQAIDAGAEFLLSPALSPGMVETAHRHGVLAVPGAYTPTEVLTALEDGAPLIKLFPADVGGPAHLRALRAPLPRARFLPTGGVRAENIAEWFAAGAAAVGIGSALVGPGERAVDAAAVRQRAGVLVRAVAAQQASD
ncbi:MAG TPA: bifunctional 4-hydroxy-2-oxoglutarate aldolase/2-dehydro-3-deoxy-phosphogluconate aldolase [bacterium]|nr:bifunctional 4-hydroxy-2-oxoglutarate aldolase/2-dehydro-3-deoxy-phosphogluconate aldolase [bacterium]